MKSRHELFKEAYDNFPSMDNEGYVPERGAFKCGFSTGFDAGYQRAVEILEEVVRDPKFYEHIATASDFAKYLRAQQ